MTKLYPWVVETRANPFAPWYRHPVPFDNLDKAVAAQEPLKVRYRAYAARVRAR